MTPEEYILRIIGFRFARFFVYIVWATLLAWALKKKTGIARSRGVTVFGVLLLTASVHKMIGLVDFAYYKIMFAHLPHTWIVVRYLASISLRVLGCATAIGLFLLKRTYYRLALALCAFNVFSLVWKHPYQTFVNINNYLNQQTTLGISISDPKFISYPMMFFSVIDAVFFISMLFFLTRPQVKAQFIKKP